MRPSEKKPGPKPVAHPAPGGQIKALIDGMAARQAAMMAGQGPNPPADPPMTVVCDKDFFRAEFKVADIDPSNASARLEGNDLVVVIGRGGGEETWDDQSHRAKASAQLWERSFHLSFKPTQADIRVTVTPVEVVVEAKRPR